MIGRIDEFNKFLFYIINETTIKLLLIFKFAF